jgi:hypothetical protein
MVEGAEWPGDGLPDGVVLVVGRRWIQSFACGSLSTATFGL